MPDKQHLNEITNRIIGAAIKVHKTLGPGLLESAYLACLALELRRRRLRVETQKPLPLEYEGAMMECAYRIDLVVEDLVVVEVKSVKSLTALHEAQLISYLKLSGCRVGLLFNFNVRVLVDGMMRRVSNFPDDGRKAPETHERAESTEKHQADSSHERPRTQASPTEFE